MASVKNRRVGNFLVSLFLPLTIQCAYAQDGYKLGEGGGPVSGGTGPDGSTGQSAQLESCQSPLGTMAVVEPQDQYSAYLSNYGLPSPTGLIRLMIQQSNCFQVVERGLAMQNIMQERQLAEGGQLQRGSNVGQGQMVTADFVMTPQVNFKENNAGGIGGALGAVGGLFGTGGAIVGALAGGVKFKQAQTTLLVADTRSGIQVAAATGAAEKSDFGLGGILGGGGVGVGLGAYENTNEGKVVAAAFLDSYNNVVRSVRNAASLVAPTSASSSKNAQASLKVSIFNIGDVVMPKINGVKLHSEANRDSKTIQKLTKESELIVDGDEVNGFVKVMSSDHEGWVEVSKVK